MAIKTGRIRVNPTLILLAVLVGLLYIGPSLMVWKNFNESGDRFVSVQHKKNSPEIQQYLSRAREIYDGHFPPAEIYGSQPARTVQNVLPSILLAGLLVLFGGSVNLAHLAALFIFSAAIFILFYWLGQIIFNSRLKSLFFALVALLTPIVNAAKETPFFGAFADFKIRFINSFLPFVKTQFAQLPLDRFDEPLLTYPIYLLAIIFFILFWQKQSRGSAILSGFFTGLLFYTYFHHWVYWVGVIGMLFLYVLIFRRSEKVFLKNYFVLLGVLALVATPYFVNYFAFSQAPYAEDFSLKVSAMRGRYLGIAKENIIDYITYLWLGALVYATYWKRDRQRAILFLGFILAMFAVWNVQLVTGIVPLQAFFRRAVAPLVFLIVFSLLYDWIAKLEIRWPKGKKYIAGVLIVLSVLAVSKNVVNVYAIGCCMQPHIAEYNKLPNGVIDSWDWINDNLPHEPKIISPSVLSSLYLPAYTSARPFLPTAYISMLGIEETDRRYLVSQKLFGVPKEALPDTDLDMLYGFYFLAKYGSFSDYFSSPADSVVNLKKAEKIDGLTVQYQAMPTPKWREVEADYVYAGPWEKELAESSFAADQNLELIYKNPEVEIYRIIR